MKKMMIRVVVGSDDDGNDDEGDDQDAGIRCSVRRISIIWDYVIILFSLTLCIAVTARSLHKVVTV